MNLVLKAASKSLVKRWLVRCFITTTSVFVLLGRLGNFPRVILDDPLYRCVVPFNRTTTRIVFAGCRLGWFPASVLDLLLLVALLLGFRLALGKPIALTGLAAATASPKTVTRFVSVRKSIVDILTRNPANLHLAF